MKRCLMLLSGVALVFLWAACSKNSSQEQITPASETATVTKTELKKGDLFRAVVKNDSLAVQDLLARGADINENMSPDAEEVTPLLGAIAMGHEELGDYLIQKGATLDSIFIGYTPRDLAHFRFGEKSRLLRSIIQKQADLEKR